MKKDSHKLTSVQLPKTLLDKMQIELIRKNFSFTKLVERAVFLYVTNDEFQKQIHNTLNTSLEG